MELIEAQLIANDIAERLAPYCEHVEIAGGVRREKGDVHDIEICCAPKMEATTDLFGESLQERRSKLFCLAAIGLGKLIKGSVEDGRYVKIDLPEDIVLDLFIPEKSDYWRQFAIRTGPAEYSHMVLAKTWFKLGWCGTADGLQLQKESFQKTLRSGKNEWVCNSKFPTLPPVWKTEQDFFEWLGLEWVAPNKRKA